MRRAVIGVAVLLGLGIVLVAAGELGLGPVVITHEDEQKVVLLLSDPWSIQIEPGLSWRIPLITEVRVFDRRLRHADSRPLQLQTRDAERPMIDHYVVWRIGDPLRFMESFPQGMTQATAQIDRIVRADVREVIGQSTLGEVVTTRRGALMKEITELSAEKLREFGIEIRDVRINRTELPRATEENVFARMTSERQRVARKYRAEGDEEGRRLRAEADRDARVTVAEANKEAEILRGEGDAEAARIYADAHATAPEFYGFLRRLEAYRKTIGSQTTLVLPPDNDFFRLLSDFEPNAAASPNAPPAALEAPPAAP